MLFLILALVAVYIFFVAKLTWSEIAGDVKSQFLWKPLASVGFCLIASLSGVLDHPSGALWMLGFFGCLLGDVLLLWREDSMFKTGVNAFMAAHVLFILALFDMGQNWTVFAIALCGNFICTMWFFNKMKPFINEDMNKQLAAYHLVILLMVSMAYGAAAAGASPWLVLGATLFAVSDMMVAKDRFIKQEAMNVAVISPLYFGAMLIFALAV